MEKTTYADIIKNPDAYAFKGVYIFEFLPGIFKIGHSANIGRRLRLWFGRRKKEDRGGDIWFIGGEMDSYYVEQSFHARLQRFRVFGFGKEYFSCPIEIILKRSIGLKRYPPPPYCPRCAHL